MTDLRFLRRIKRRRVSEDGWKKILKKKKKDNFGYAVEFLVNYLN